MQQEAQAKEAEEEAEKKRRWEEEVASKRFWVRARPSPFAGAVLCTIYLRAFKRRVGQESASGAYCSPYAHPFTLGVI